MSDLKNKLRHRPVLERGRLEEEVILKRGGVTPAQDITFSELCARVFLSEGNLSPIVESRRWKHTVSPTIDAILSKKGVWDFSAL